MEPVGTPEEFTSLLLDLLSDVGNVIASDVGAGLEPPPAIASTAVTEMGASGAADTGNQKSGVPDDAAAATAQLEPSASALAVPMLDMLTIQPTPSSNTQPIHSFTLPAVAPSAAAMAPGLSMQAPAPPPIPPPPSAWHVPDNDAAWPDSSMWPDSDTGLISNPQWQGSGDSTPALAIPTFLPQQTILGPSGPSNTAQQQPQPSQATQLQQQPSTGLQHRQSHEGGKEHSSSAGQRRKRPTSTQVMADLQAQLSQQVALAKQLAMNNIWLAERMRIMELVIAVRSGQVARVHEIRKGMDFNPFLGFRSTVQEMKEATPGKLADKLLEITGGMAMRLAAIQPLLQTNPHLLALSQPAGPIPPAHMVFDPHTPVVAPPLPPLFDFTHAHMLSELQQLIVEVQRMQMSYSFLYLMHPHMLRVGNVNLQALQDSAVSWDSLMEDMSTEQATAGVAAGQLPTIAPEVQWVKLSESLRLSDLQRLRCAALWDIISRARQSVLQQRVHLAQAVAQVLLQSQADGPLAAAAPAAPPTSLQPPGSNKHSKHTARPGSSGGGVPQQPQQQPQAASSAHSGGSSVGAAGAAGAVGAAGAGMSEAMSGGLETKGGRLEGQGRAVLSKSPAALQQEAALLEKLQYNLIKERCLIVIAAETMFRFIFSPVQNAVALVSAYPFVLDQMAVLHACATEFQPLVLDRLAATLESANAAAAATPAPPATPPATASGAAGGGKAGQVSFVGMYRPTLSTSGSMSRVGSGSRGPGGGADVNKPSSVCAPSAAS